MTRLCFLLGEATAGTASSPMEDRKEKKVGHLMIYWCSVHQKSSDWYDIIFYFFNFIISFILLFLFFLLLLLFNLLNVDRYHQNHP